MIPTKSESMSFRVSKVSTKASGLAIEPTVFGLILLLPYLIIYNKKKSGCPLMKIVLEALS